MAELWATTTTPPVVVWAPPTSPAPYSAPPKIRGIRPGDATQVIVPRGTIHLCAWPVTAAMCSKSAS